MDGSTMDSLLHGAQRILWWYALRYGAETLGWPAHDLYQEGVEAFLLKMATMETPVISHGIVEGKRRMQCCIREATTLHALPADVVRRMPMLTPEQHLLNRETWQLVQQAWTTLSSRQQQIMDLRYEEGATTTSVGTVLGLDHSSVSREVAKALRHIRAALGIDTVSIAQADARTCPYGHPWTPDNTRRWQTKRGYVQIVCKACHRRTRQKSYRKAHPRQGMKENL